MFAFRGSSFRIALALALLLLPCCAMAQADDQGPDSDYRPGRGWQVAGGAFQLGGYASAGYRDLRNSEGTLGISDLSLFVHWESAGKFRFFSEIALEDPVEYALDGNGLNTGRAYLGLERLYGDYLYADGLNFRAGKFLTPIGRWNVIHADPLVWTTSRPLITERSFPTNATGIMLFGTVPLFGRSADYSIYSAVGEDWRPDPKLDPFEEAYGLHVTVPVSAAAELGLSLVSFEQKASVGERRKLLGIDYAWSRNRYELSAEAALRLSDEGHLLEEKGLFIQGVAPLTERLYGIGRYEFYDQAGPQRPVNIWLLGMAMKLSPAFVLKLEYRQASRRQELAPSGLLTSVSILF